MQNGRTTTRRRFLRASLLAGGGILALAGAAFADAPVATSIDVSVDGMTVTVSGDWAWADKDAPCGPGTSDNRAAGWAADWGDGWDGNFVPSKGAPRGTGYHMGDAEDNAVRVSDANGGLGDCGEAAPIPLSEESGGVIGTWGPISYTYSAAGTYEICVVMYDVRYYGTGENLRLRDAKQLVAGGPNRNKDNSAEKEYLNSGQQCAGGGTPIVVEVESAVLQLTKTATEDEFTPLAGAVVNYRFRVENIGDGPTTSPITIEDPLVTDVSCPVLTEIGNEDADLDPGEVVVCVGVYTVTEDDIAAGIIENTATAHSGPISSEPSTAIVIEAPTIQVLLDESGSVASDASRTIDAYNAFLARWRTKHPQAVFGLNTFSTRRYVSRYNGRPIGEVPNLNQRIYQPGGTTNLWDSIVRSVEELSDRSPASNVIYIIYTDGKENASTQETRGSVAALIRSKEKDGWTFRYRGWSLAGLAAEVAALR